MRMDLYFRFPGAAFRILPEFTLFGDTAGLTMRMGVHLLSNECLYYNRLFFQTSFSTFLMLFFSDGHGLSPVRALYQGQWFP